MHQLLAPASALLVLAFAVPAAGEEMSAAAAAEAARTCPGLFGADVSVEENRALREARIEVVEETSRGLLVRHHVGRWKVPVARRLRGLDLVEIHAADAGRTAVIAVGGPWADLCGERRYQVGADDALGASGRVLMVLNEGLLVELAGDLVFVAAPGAKPPRFDLVWSSDYLLVAGEGSSSSSSSVGASGSARGTRASTSRSAIRKAEGGVEGAPLKAVTDRKDLADRARESARERRRAAQDRAKKE